MHLGPHLRRTVVDTGLPGQWNDLQAELRAIGRSLADIRGIVLTHGDSDHVGFAERLRRETGCPCTCTRPTPTAPAAARSRRPRGGR